MDKGVSRTRRDSRKQSVGIGHSYQADSSQRYLIGVAQKHELYRYIRFNSSVDEARWDDAEKKWKTAVTVAGGKDAEFGEHYTLTSDFLVSAVGQLNQPKYPDIPGLSDFKGKIMVSAPSKTGLGLAGLRLLPITTNKARQKQHSARWDWSYDLQDKKIAIIGNGATAAQIIPELAKVAKQLTVHQRTPNWVIPRADAPIPPWKRAVFKYVPPIRWRYRADMMDFRESFYDAVIDKNTPFAALLADMSIQLMKTQLPDREDLWPKLTPNYAIGCKRVIITDDYFPVFNQSNVTLETGKIAKITETGIEIEGEAAQDYDLIVLATGFRTIEFMHPINIIGSGGRSLSSIWSGGAKDMYATLVESLPNFAMLYGPNGNLGHNSIVLMIEAQSRYISALVKEILAAKLNGKTLTLAPKKEKVDRYNERIQKVLQNSSFADPNCGSWYKDPKTGLITNNWSGTVVQFQKMLSNVDWSDFDLAGSGAEGLQDEGRVTKIGRVVEESTVSYRTMGLTAASLAAVGVGVMLRATGRLRLR